MAMKAAAPPFTYLVTGGNRGIGLAFTQALLARGERVIATARDPEAASDLSRMPARVERLDVADPQSVSALARRLEGAPLDVLINNAGIGKAGSGLARLSMDDLEETYRVNAVGPVAVTQALLPNLRSGRRRMVVCVTSGLGSIAGNLDGGWYAYRAAKSALNQLTRTMAAELSSEGFTFLLVSPGWVQTRMGGSGAPLTPQDSVRSMLRLLDRAKPSDSGRFFDHDGKEIAW